VCCRRAACRVPHQRGDRLRGASFGPDDAHRGRRAVDDAHHAQARTRRRRWHSWLRIWGRWRCPGPAAPTRGSQSCHTRPDRGSTDPARLHRMATSDTRPPGAPATGSSAARRAARASARTARRADAVRATPPATARRISPRCPARVRRTAAGSGSRPRSRRAVRRPAPWGSATTALAGTSGPVRLYDDTSSSSSDTSHAGALTRSRGGPASARRTNRIAALARSSICRACSNNTRPACVGSTSR
jgi:hypothetical protein